MDTLIVDASKYLILVPLLMSLFIFMDLDKAKRKQFLLMVIIGGALSLLIAKIGSHFYTDPRPAFKDGVIPLFANNDYNGFPSDHTLLASFLAFVALYYSRMLGLLLIVAAALIGWARVAAGVHHFVDIIGSFIITAVVVFALTRIIDTRKPGIKARQKSEKLSGSKEKS
ncbi:phosphatase PAP2 family protein [Candidatus Saccharibacteria bacterium]|nr:phosphatase PAP2 family protein [Candidatus Saccharibacteria bacterium]